MKLREPDQILSKDVTTVQLKKKTRERLDKQGFRHESYDDIVNRLIDEHESRKK